MNQRVKDLYGDDIRRLGFMYADFRRKRGMTQRQVAAEVCRVQSRVSDLETGVVDSRISSLIMFADAKIRLAPRE